MSSRSETKNKSKTSKRSKARARSTRRAARARPAHVQSPEHRERFHRARRALRHLRQHVFFPKAVLHTNKAHVPAELMNEVPEQALIEHWEAIGELKSKGIDIRHTNARAPRPHMLRTVELDAPISAHARQFASNHGLVIRERKSPIRSSLERIFG